MADIVPIKLDTGHIIAVMVPGDTIPEIYVFPDQTGHSGQFLTTNGVTVSWAPTASGILLESNSVPNSSQSILNLIQGANITITDGGSGNITIASSGGAGGITQINTDSTAHQLLVTGTSGTDFAILDNLTGTHTFNLPIASAVNTGKLSHTDWSTFNSKQNALTIGNISDVGTDGITIGGGTGAIIGAGVTVSQHVADSTHNGYLSSADWVTFNGKQPALTTGNLTDIGTDGITIGNGTGSVIGTGTTISQHVADATHNGYLSSTDWVNFNNIATSGITYGGPVTGGHPNEVLYIDPSGNLTSDANFTRNSGVNTETIIGVVSGADATSIHVQETPPLINFKTNYNGFPDARALSSEFSNDGITGTIEIGDCDSAFHGTTIAINDVSQGIMFSYNGNLYTFPIGHGTAGQTFIDDGGGNLSWGNQLALQVNGTPNTDQFLLNLIAGTNITLTDNGVGGVTIDASGGGGSQTLAQVLTTGNDAGNSIPIFDLISINDTGNVLEIDTVNRLLIDSSGTRNSIDWQNRFLYDSSGTIITAQYGTATLNDITGQTSVDWSARQLYNSLGTHVVADWSIQTLYDNTFFDKSIDWNNRQLWVNTTLTLDWINEELYDGGTVSLHWGNKQMFDNSSMLSIDWQNRLLIDTAGTSILNFATPSTLNVPYMAGNGAGVVACDNSGNLSWVGSSAGTIYPSLQIPVGDGSTPGGITTANLEYDTVNDILNAGNTSLLIGNSTGGLGVLINIDSATDSVLIGQNGTTTGGIGNEIVAIGDGAGTGAAVNDGSTYIGQLAGSGNTATGTQLFIGGLAGYQNSGANAAVGIGGSSLYFNTGSDAVAVGGASGQSNTGNHFVGIGNAAGYGNTGTDHIYIGFNNVYGTNTGDYVLCLGTNAGQGNPISNAFIVDNNHMPTYANHVAALAAISPTGIAGNTYLYYDQATLMIGGVRL